MADHDPYCYWDASFPSMSFDVYGSFLSRSFDVYGQYVNNYYGHTLGTSFSMGELRLESPIAAAQSSDMACGEDEVSL